MPFFDCNAMATKITWLHLSTGIPLSLPIAFTYQLIPTGLHSQYIKPYLYIVGNRFSFIALLKRTSPLSHCWEARQPIIPIVILLQFQYLLTNILFVGMRPSLIGSRWGSKSPLKALERIWDPRLRWIHFAKDKKFWRHTAWRIGSEGMQPEGQGLEGRKINSRRNPLCIW